jgi:perosamine synthetase
MNWKIPLFKIFSDETDCDQVNEVIRSGMNWATGPKVQEFESDISNYTQRKYSVTFNSGTSALHALMLSHGFKPGDEVIVPSFTFISTANSPLFVGAKPIFADIEEETYGLDPENVLEKIGPKTRAVMPVHIGGCSCKIREIAEICSDHNITLIEDAAESLGAKNDGEMVGTFGDSAMFSFCGPKVITTGEGGVIVTELKELYERLKLIRSHGRAETQDYFSTNQYLDYVQLGYNWRMSNITAALGISQLKKIDLVIEKRRENAAYLTNKLKNIKEINTPVEPEDRYHLFQMYTIKAEQRDELMKHLAEKFGIMAKVYFPPIHHSYFYREILKTECQLPKTEQAANQVLTLPMYPQLTTDEMDTIYNAIQSFYSGE